MAKLEIDKIQARCQAATPGKWVVESRGVGNGVMVWMDERPICKQADFDFIAHARKDIPTLLKALDNEKSFRIAIQNQHEAFIQDVKKDVEEFGIREHKLKLKLKDWKARAEKAEASLAAMEQQGEEGVPNGKA